MKHRAVLLLLLVSMLVSIPKIGVATAWSGTIFIRADGTVDPPTAPIQRNGDIYKLIDDINMTTDGSCIVVEKDNVVLDGANHTISGLGFGVLASGVSLSAFNVTARNINVYRFHNGIAMVQSTNHNNVTGCNIRRCGCGISLDTNDGNSISKNQVTNNEICGIKLNNSTSNNITLNDIADRIELVYSSSNNKIVGNNIERLTIDPVESPFSVNNSIYHNYFAAPGLAPEVGPWSPQIWDDGYPSGGNLWVDYYGFDFRSGPYQNAPGSDGIGDTPYVMDENNTDHYPWMMMRTSSPVPPVAKIKVQQTEESIIGDTVILDASRSVSGWTGTQVAPITEYIWNFDDGNITSTTQRTVSHTYQSAKSFRFEIRLTVADTEGRNSSASTTIGVHMPTSISVSTTSPSLLIGFAVGINGSLYDLHRQGLEGKTIFVSFTFIGASSWFPITSCVTDSHGRYWAQWIPTASGSFTIKVEWAGNLTHFGTNNTVSLGTIPYQNQYVLSVESNSTISALLFNSASFELSFGVNGGTSTKGYVKATIAKSLVSNIADVKAYLDGKQTEYSATSQPRAGGAWLLSFTYVHSTHNVTVDLNPEGVDGKPSPLIYIVLAAAAVAFIAGIIILWQKKGKPVNMPTWFKKFIDRHQVISESENEVTAV